MPYRKAKQAVRPIVAATLAEHHVFCALAHAHGLLICSQENTLTAWVKWPVD